MNRYPFWKYLIIAIALVVGALYTLPNFYGEAPAVQIAPVRSALKVDTALLARVEQILKTANIQSTGIFLDATGLKVRFESIDTQYKAKDVLLHELGEGYTVAFNLLSNSPRWLSSMGALPMYLGLDLRGGVHFLLQVDMKAALTKSLEGSTGDIRRTLQEKKIYYSTLGREGSSVVVKFRDQSTLDKARDEIRKLGTELDIREQAEDGVFKLTGTLSEQAQKRIKEFAIQQNVTTLRNRVNELGVAEPIVQMQGDERIVVQLPGVQDTGKAKELLGRTATLEMRMIDEDHSTPADLQAATQGQLPLNTELYYDRDDRPYLVKKEVILTGERINDAQAGFDAQNNEPAVHIRLDGVGARIFQLTTRDNVGKRLAMLLVEKGKAEVVTAPVIKDEIGGGRVQISGHMNTGEAHDVALLLRAGALAAPMEIIEERTVGPSLGAENIKTGFHSTWVGFSAIAIFMTTYYLLFGAISVTALAINVAFLVALLSMLQATLTLPGMAGIALTVGMAIDANVLINERIREEVRNGTTPHAAISLGYERAFGTILDSNITTFIAGVALFAFGSGSVRGFAVVLCLGILTSMFSAVMVSRGIVNLVYGGRKKIEKLSIG